MPDPLADIPDKDALRVTACVDAVLRLRGDFPGTDPAHIAGYTDAEVTAAKAFIARMEAEPTARKARRKEDRP